MFGSIAAGKDTSDSDIDLLVVGNVDLLTISPLLDAVEQELERSVHVSLYSEAQWLSGDDPILQSIKMGPRIKLMGRLRGAAS